MTDGWEIKSLGDVLKLEYGKPLPEEDRDDKGAYPAYGANGIKCRTRKFLCERPGIIVGRKGSAGEVTLTEERFWPLDVTYFVAFDDRRYDLKFLYLCLRRLHLTRLANGVKPGLNRNDVYQLNFSFPSLGEQKRIVSLIDGAFARLDAAVANAEKNLTNVHEMFGCYLAAKFANNGIMVPLRDLASEITDGDHSPPPKAKKGIPFITISDIVKSTRDIDFSDTFLVPEEYFNGLKSNKKPRIGDVLYTVTGATLGIPVLVKQQRDFCFQRHIGLIRPNKSTDSRWLAYGLLSPQVFKQATEGSTGTAQKTVSLSVLRGLALPKSSLVDQKRIAGLLDELSDKTLRLEAIYRRKLADLTELKQAILQKAFAGELTAQPERLLQHALA